MDDNPPPNVPFPNEELAFNEDGHVRVSPLNDCDKYEAVLTLDGARSFCGGPDMDITLAGHCAWHKVQPRYKDWIIVASAPFILCIPRDRNYPETKEHLAWMAWHHNFPVTFCAREFAGRDGL